jgi:hypothetical protein
LALEADGEPTDRSHENPNGEFPASITTEPSSDKLNDWNGPSSVIIRGLASRLFGD